MAVNAGRQVGRLLAFERGGAHDSNEPHLSLAIVCSNT